MSKILSIFLALVPASECLALAQQDVIASWGINQYGQVSTSPTGRDFIQVAAGSGHSLALHLDGSIESWGKDGSGQVTDTPLGIGFIQVASGWNHSLALDRSGSITSWGYDGNGQVSNTPTSGGFVQIAGGANHSLALQFDGSIVSWGSDSWGQVSNTPTGHDFVQVAGGSSHSLALRRDGSIVSWGLDTSGEVSGTPPGTDFVQVAGGGSHSLALRLDGSIVAWGSDSHGGVSTAPTGMNFVQIADGQSHSLALKSDGTLLSWGNDSFGAVSSTPTGTGFFQIVCGSEFSLALSGTDSDGDGLLNRREDINENGIVDQGETDPFDQDSDDDGLGDGEEVDSLRTDTRWLQSPTGSYYRLAPANTWSQARLAAVAQGYDLTSIQDQAEADWLYSTFGEVSGGFWIGLNDFSGIFEWSDGSPVNYTQWATGEPNTTFVAAYIGGLSEAEPGNWYADFAGITPRRAVWESPGPNAPQTALDPLAWDTDGDGLSDGQEDGVDSIYWDGFGIAGVTGTDPLLFTVDADPLTTTDPLDLDSDEDGLTDGEEDLDGDGATGIGETNPTLFDTDGDTLADGLELGLTTATLDTDGNVFTPDADPLSTTNPLVMDTDAGGISDGLEDQNSDGAINTWETDPNLPADDEFAFYVSNVQPGQKLQFEVYQATPNTPVIPAVSVAGNGPVLLSIGVTLDLSLPILTFFPVISGPIGFSAWEGPRVPGNVPHGKQVWFQAVEIPFSPVLQPRASNPILLPVGSN